MKAAIIDGAINGMIDALGDPYSDYLNEKEARQLNESISSSFEGIGAEIQEQDGYITVVSPIKNSPARTSRHIYRMIKLLQSMVKVFKECLHQKLFF